MSGHSRKQCEEVTATTIQKLPEIQTYMIASVHEELAEMTSNKACSSRDQHTVLPNTGLRLHDRPTAGHLQPAKALTPETVTRGMGTT